MAIIIEEQRERLGFLNVLIWLVILLMLGAGTYYVFFKKPELYEVATPVNLESTQELVRITINPDDVIQSPQFQALKQYITPTQAVTVGRPNPFMSF